jgi:hypothetical protein
MNVRELDQGWSPEFLIYIYGCYTSTLDWCLWTPSIASGGLLRLVALSNFKTVQDGGKVTSAAHPERNFTF